VEPCAQCPMGLVRDGGRAVVVRARRWCARNQGDEGHTTTDCIAASPQTTTGSTHPQLCRTPTQPGAWRAVGGAFARITLSLPLHPSVLACALRTLPSACSLM
jgi:hypothetical protein